jgi:hypothetical protein
MSAAAPEENQKCLNLNSFEPSRADSHNKHMFKGKSTVDY